MGAILDVLDTAVGVEPESQVQPDQVTGQIVESAGSSITLEQEHQPQSEPEPEPQPEPNSIATPAAAIMVPDTETGSVVLPEQEIQLQPDQALGQIVEQAESVITPKPQIQSDQQPTDVQDEDAATETKLTAEICDLWSQQRVLNGTRKTTARELRLVRGRLGEKLYKMKSLLSRPGRGGEWRGWLREQGIARSSADRWVSRYAESLTNEAGNVLNEAINDGADAVEKLVHSLLPRLKRTLPDTQSVFKFIAAIGATFGLQPEITEDCIMVSQPKPDQSEPATSAADVPDVGSAEVQSPEPENTSCGIPVQPETLIHTAAGE